ncbi:putative C-S lyase [Nitrogeniibacter mangrovi]|uniref:cysteine-S-conjugate beta-lyase n=1 Tax=Nitrogeniibacter mangrovi TaxID=2016596 RepID=A0A6C1B5M4_9RHOO|nr:PatB family C-S lyase [Nitrogeniibacter mangrovi]QID19026.1 putative C-S lyase [Nitrogeniibacter mangrovi]
MRPRPPEFDFTTPVDRRAVPGDKWGRYAGRDVIPMWVADMDFAAPPAVLEALHARIDHGVFGYTDAWPSLIEAVVEGIARDHDWHIEPDWLVWLPGVVTGFNVACALAGGSGDGVFTATPVYPPFLGAPANVGRQLQRADLVCAADHWQWDWEAVDAAIDARTRMILLCNPHNPVGRVFTRDELSAVADRALRHDLIICSDEIHCGLVLDGTHVPIAAIDPHVARRTITLMAPSKTWNIAALYSSFAIIPDPVLRRRYRRAMRGLVPHPNVLGLVATEAAYREGNAWRLALLDTLRHNRDQVMAAVAALPGLRTTVPEATYLAWIDCREAGLDDPAAFFEAHGVGLSDGKAFGAPAGWLRLNFGCPPVTLQAGLDRMATALSAR